ncbi:MAG: site-specific integrase [Hyphomicrobiales bacterium]|nr:MAG: site-specific integrase [Hyphomicrobiales bacterium]
MALLRAGVEALEKQKLRQQGYSVSTCMVHEPSEPSADSPAESLTSAFEGWRKATRPSAGTAAEFAHAIERFKKLHGDVVVGAITRRHVATFREALQRMPKRRSGEVRELPLPALVEWVQRHPDTPCIQAGTVNKLLGGVGAIVEWAGRNGFVDDSRPWVNPFTRMRLEREQPEREHWSIEDLRTLFNSAIFTQGKRPRGGAGEAAFWLPLMALFTGARLGELAALTASDLMTDEETGIPYLRITEDAALQSTLKTKGSRRAVPLHPELTRLGLLRLIEERRGEEGVEALLFPKLKPADGSRWGSAWSKWFGAQIRKLGIPPPTVFHSMRHGFKDALRRAGVGEDISDALTGHSGGGVGRTYGSKDMLSRFGAKRLHEAVAAVRYPGLDLQCLTKTRGHQYR